MIKSGCIRRKRVNIKDISKCAWLGTGSAARGRRLLGRGNKDTRRKHCRVSNSDGEGRVPRSWSLQGGCRCSLAFDAQVHDVIAADGAIVHLNVPAPSPHCRPLRMQSAGIIVGGEWVVGWGVATLRISKTGFSWKGASVIKEEKLFLFLV